MARMSKARKKATVSYAVFVAGALATLAGASPAASLSLPSVTVSVPVTTPTVAVPAPPAPVKTPTVSTPVKAPTPPLEVPTVPVKAPTVTVKATTSVSTSPTVSVKASPTDVRVPSVSVKASTGSAGGSIVSVKASSTSATSRSATSASPSRSAATRSGSAAAAGANQSGPGSLGLGLGGAADAGGVSGYGLSPGYGELPAFARQLSHRARARIAARERSLKATVAQLRGCLGSLPERQRRLLELRAGLGAKPLGPRAAAARLHVAYHRFAKLERRALRALRASAGTHGCAKGAGQVVAGVMSFIGAAFGAGPGELHGGLKPVSYDLDPKGLRAFLPHAQRSDDGPLGAGISPAATDALLALVLVLVAGLVMTVAAVVGAAGRGPRDPEWRRRVAARFRSPR